MANDYSTSTSNQVVLVVETNYSEHHHRVVSQNFTITTR